MFLKSEIPSSKVFLYFHANAEDLGRCLNFLGYIQIYMRVNVIAVEYPGYGVYKKGIATAD